MTPVETLLRNALVRLVGASDPKELMEMRDAVAFIEGPDQIDRDAMIGAIDALLGTKDAP